MSVEAADETPVRAGTPPTFDDFVHAHADRLLRLSLLLSGDRGTAEDAVQEALSRACPRWERISRAHDPLAYVRRMVINAHHTWWRSVGRRERPSAVLPEATYADAADAAQLAAGARRTSVGCHRAAVGRVRLGRRRSSGSSHGGGGMSNRAG